MLNFWWHAELFVQSSCKHRSCHETCRWPQAACVLGEMLKEPPCTYREKRLWFWRLYWNGKMYCSLLLKRHLFCTLNALLADIYWRFLALFMILDLVLCPLSKVLIKWKHFLEALGDINLVSVCVYVYMYVCMCVYIYIGIWITHCTDTYVGYLPSFLVGHMHIHRCNPIPLSRFVLLIDYKKENRVRKVLFLREKLKEILYPAVSNIRKYSKDSIACLSVWLSVLLEKILQMNIFVIDTL